MKYGIYSDKIKIYVRSNISKSRFRHLLHSIKQDQPGLPIWYDRNENSILYELTTKIILNRLFHRNEQSCISLNFSSNVFNRILYFLTYHILKIKKL